MWGMSGESRFFRWLTSREEPSGREGRSQPRDPLEGVTDPDEAVRILWSITG